MVFVGGVSDGIEGAAALDYNREGVAGKKSWFMFGNRVVCLGAGLRAQSETALITGIDQCLLRGSVTIADVRGTHTLSEMEASHPAWVFHNGVGYIFPGSQNVTIRATPQHGLWRDIYAWGPVGSTTRDVFTLWLDHGTHPGAAEYAYMILPAGSAQQMASLAADTKFKILCNTPARQAVTDDTAAMAIFYVPGAQELAGARIEVDHPCALIVRKQDTGVRAYVSDPTQKLSSLQIKVNGGLIPVTLPPGALAGSSVEVAIH